MRLSPYRGLRRARWEIGSCERRQYPASGVDITLSPSSDGTTPVAGIILESIHSGGKVPPGKSAKFRLRFKATSALMAGSYYPYVSVSLGSVPTTTVGVSQFAIG